MKRSDSNRSRRLAGAALACGALLVLAGTAHAQSNYLLQTGGPTFTTAEPVELGFINAANGNLHLEIPIASSPQRGKLGFAAKLVYDSRIWEPSVGAWHPDNVVGALGGKGGWRFITSADTGSVDNGTWVENCLDPYFFYVTGSTTYFGPFTWTAPDGTSRTFPISTQSVSGTNCLGTDVPTGNAFAQDSSGYRMYANYGSATIYAKDGTQVYPTMQDTNGNYFSTDVNGNVVDTLGRTVVTKTVVGNTINYDVLKSVGSLSRFAVTTQLVDVCTSFGQPGFTEYCSVGPAQQITVITGIALPNGTSYSFTYDNGTVAGSFGLIKSITLPTGGQVQYGFTTFADSYSNRNRWVSGRIASQGGVWGYSPLVLSYCVTGQTGCQETVTIGKPNGDQKIYTFTLNNGSWSTQAQYYQGSSTLQATVSSGWDFTQPCSAGACYVRKLTETTTLPDTLPLKKQVTYTYDNPQNGNLAAIKEWNYYTGSPSATPDRETDIAYLTSPTYANKNIIALPSSITVMGGATVMALTTLTYDSTPLTAVSGMPHHDDANFGTSNTVRGNPTVTQRCVSFGGGLCSGWLGTGNTGYYDTTGQLTQSTDPKGNSTQLAYSVDFKNAYPTTITNALTQNVNINYDWNTGLVASVRDANGNLTSFFYDSLNRLTETDYPDGGHDITNFTSPTFYDVYKYITSTVLRHDTIALDGFGLTITNTLVTDPAGPDIVTSAYDALGRVASRTNPYRGTSAGGDSFAYDALSRVTSVTHADASTLRITYGGATPLCSGVVAYAATTTDEAGNQRRIFTDAFGQTVEVDEPNPPSPAPSVNTCYSYDVLGNLRTVTQGVQTRTYNYDMLSRLTSAATPESGTTTYTYDANGNVLTRTDARNITTTYVYDTLNRLLYKTYNDTPQTAPSVYTYDVASRGGVALTNPIGRMVAAERACHGNLYSYDQMGRVTQEIQYDPADCGASGKTLTYWYNLAGGITTYNNGVGVMFWQTMDTAGRVAVLSSSLNDAQHPPTLATVNQRGPAGQIGKMTYGNNLTQTAVYNSRLQPCRMNVNSGGAALNACTDALPPGNTQDYNYSYGSANNGNVISWAAAGSQTFTRGYTYDALNRLKTMNSPTDPSTCKGLSWTYDAWGNRTDQTTTLGLCANFHQAVGANNQLTTFPYQYDAAGNMTNDGTHSYTYDAENRIIAVDGGVTASFVYDAMGRREAKVVGGVRTRYIYDLAGNVGSEVQGGVWSVVYAYLDGQMVAQYKNGTTYFAHPDHLGSTRLLTGVTGAVTDSLDYLPFGELLADGTGTTHKFTGKERDAESGLDDYPARYLSSTMARWMTADPLAGEVENPQSLNRYAYVLNNPTTFTDPSGLECVNVGNGVWGDDGKGKLCDKITGNTPGQVTVYGGGGGTVDFDLACKISTSMCFAYITGLQFQQGSSSSGSGPGTSSSGTASWTKAFAKDFFTNFGARFSKSCFGQFLTTVKDDFTPGPSPSASDMAQNLAEGSKFVSQTAALLYAASRPNYLGGTGLLYPLKSGAVRGIIKIGVEVSEAAPLIGVDVALLHSVITTSIGAYRGQCE